MKFQVGHPGYLLLLPLALGWVFWLAWKTDVQTSNWRRWGAWGLRSLIVMMLLFALAELQFKWPLQGMNIFYLLDRSASIPPGQGEFARDYINQSVHAKERDDQGGVVVFGAEASIENSASPALKIDKIQSVVGTEYTDIGGAIQLATVAFPEAGQKRIVLLSDGNENTGNAMAAAAQARSLGISIDVLPLSIRRGNDVSVQRLVLPPNLKSGQVFEAKVFIDADRAQTATVSLYRNEKFLGSQKVELSAGKNLFTFPQTLSEPGFYGYDVRVDAAGDTVPENNRATAFVNVRGIPRVLVISSDPEADRPLVEALRSAELEIRSTGINAIPATLAELQSYDAIFLSNIAAGDLPRDWQKMLESAVQDFGTGLVCVGGDQTYTAGAYRGTPLEDVLPLSMELDSKKVLPSGALMLVIDKSGSMAGAKIEAVKDAAKGAVAALGNNDYVGVLTFDGAYYVVADLQKAVNKKEIMENIGSLEAGGGTAMYPPMVKAHEMLQGVHANLKHCIVLTDGDSLPGDFDGVTQAMAADKITVSTVGVGGDINRDLLQSIATKGKGRFYEVTSPDIIPQIFIKETAIILKSAIDEEPFKPQLRGGSELVRGIGAGEYPALQGYVVTEPKARAEIPLVTHKGDPLLAHWQYGLGRAVAFTSDARAKWATDWLGWGKYKQFWTQVAQWSLRRLENADFTTEVSVEGGEGHVGVEALDEQGNYRNFLNLNTVVVSPGGGKTRVTLQQTGAGHYEARFPIRETGLYMLNLLDEKNGQVRGSQTVGASVNYSPEYSTTEPNMNLLRRIAEMGEGRLLNPENPTEDNPFEHDRKPAYRSMNLWEWLLRLAVVLFPLDVAVRRVQLDADEMARAMKKLRGWLWPWGAPGLTPEPVESLAMLLARRDQARSLQPRAEAEIKAAPGTFAGANAGDLEKTTGPTSDVISQPKPAEDVPAAEPMDLTGRLLEAKRRAQARKRR